MCCKYFEKYDIELESVSLKAQNVMDKYQDWSKVLIEPASLNDARLFSVESRIHEEEEIRMKEYEFLRDLMKKLIYSFEQSNMGGLDLSTQAFGMPSVDTAFGPKGSNSPIPATQSRGKMMLNQSSVQKASTHLPNLLNNSSLQHSVREMGNEKLQDSLLGTSNNAIHHTSTDIMMLKRLNFLRNSLSSHNPRETTQYLRDQANRIRDERILELWKLDQEQPSVYELVQRMKKEKEEKNMTMGHFDTML